MPLNTPIQSVDLKGWSGGLNREADPFLLEVTESPHALNVDFGLRGEVSKRKGYTKHTTDDSTASAGAFLYGWTKLGGSDFFIYTDLEGDVFYASGTTLTSAAIAFGAHSSERTFDIAHASMNDRLYLSTNRTGALPHKFDGSAWTALTVTNFDGTANRFPRARVLVQAHERMFAFNVTDGNGTAFRSRMHWSDPLLPETWAALDFIDFAPDDGQEITGAALFGEQIIVFKNHSMFSLSGTDENSFTVYPIDTAVGTECPGTIVPAGPELLFFDHLTGVWSFDGTSYKKVDDKINRYLLDGVNAEYAYLSHAFAYRGRYYLCVPWDTSQVPNRTFVFDARLGAWTEYTFGWRGSAVKDALMYASAPAAATGIFKMWLVDADAGSNISAVFETGWLSPEEPSFRYRLRRLDLAFSAFGNYNVTVEMRRDFTQDAYISQVVNTSPGGALFDFADFDFDDFGSGQAQVLSRTTGWGERWRTCKFVFSEATANPFQINRMVMQVSKLGRLRGEP
jgi:hypothetical protein